MRAVNAADASTYGQTARKEASTAAHSGEMQGKAPPHHSTPLPPLRGGRMVFCSRFAEKEEQEAGTECEADGSEYEGGGEVDVCLQPTGGCWADAKSNTPCDRIKAA